MELTGVTPLWAICGAARNEPPSENRFTEPGLPEFTITAVFVAGSIATSTGEAPAVNGGESTVGVTGSTIKACPPLLMTTPMFVSGFKAVATLFVVGKGGTRFVVFIDTELWSRMLNTKTGTVFVGLAKRAFCDSSLMLTPRRFESVAMVATGCA